VDAIAKSEKKKKIGLISLPGTVRIPRVRCVGMNLEGLRDHENQAFWGREKTKDSGLPGRSAHEFDWRTKRSRSGKIISSRLLNEEHRFYFRVSAAQNDDVSARIRSPWEREATGATKGNGCLGPSRTYSGEKRRFVFVMDHHSAYYHVRPNPDKKFWGGGH